MHILSYGKYSGKESFKISERNLRHDLALDTRYVFYIKHKRKFGSSFDSNNLRFNFCFFIFILNKQNIVLAKNPRSDFFFFLIQWKLIFKINQYFYSTLIPLAMWKHCWGISCTERGISVMISGGRVIIYFEVWKNFSKTYNSVTSCSDEGYRFSPPITSFFYLKYLLVGFYFLL